MANPTVQAVLRRPAGIVPVDFQPRRILLCQQRQLGDVLLATPAVSLLKERFPQAEIHFLTEKKCLPILEHHPDIFRLWTVERTAGPLNQLRLYAAMAAQGFDVAVSFQSLPRCSLALLASRARIRLGFLGRRRNRLVYTHQYTPHEGYPAATKAELLAPLGVAYDGRPPRLYLTPVETAWAAGFLRSLGVGKSDLLVTVDATHRRATRKWPGEHYAKLMADALAAEPRLRFLLLYGPGEQEEVQAILAALPWTSADDHRRVLLPPRMLSLRELAAVLSQARLHLGNCSAPRHMAVAVGTPSLTVQGATGPEWTFPGPEHVSISLGLDCQPCDRNECEVRMACLTDLLPEVVLAKMLEMLGRE